MTIIASDKGGGRDFEPVSAGGHPAICDMMVDLGLQDGGNFGPKHKVYLRFQVADERVEYEKDGETFDLPAVIGVTMTVSLSEKSNLRPFLESWRGKAFTADEVRGFDITTVAGKPAYINVIHAPGKRDPSKTFAEIASIMPIPKGMGKPELEGEVIIHDDDNNRYDDLPKWLQEKIDNQINETEPEDRSGGGDFGRPSRPQPAVFDNDLDDDVPF